MLNSLRSSGSNIFVWIIILLLIVGLAGFGINQSGGGQARTAVASVGDADITVEEYVQALNNETRRLSQQFRTNITVEQLSQFGVDRQILSELLNNAALDNEAMQAGVSAGDEIVRENLMATPAFMGADGSFSQTAYEFSLSNAGLEPSDYDEMIRRESARQIFRAVVAGGTKLPDSGPQAMVNYLSEERAIDWLRILPSHLATPVETPDDATIQAQYDDNQDAYIVPESRKITYAAATETQLADSVTVSDEDIQALYDDRAATYAQPARRLVDRIIFSTDEEAAAALSAIQDGSKAFDDVASDRGLSADDIDQGELREEDLTPAEATMLFGSDTLGVVGPIPTDFGPALYRVNAVLDATLTTLDEVRDELRQELALEVAADLISSETDAIIDLIAGGASIEEVAAETILELTTVALPGDEDTDPMANEINFLEEAAAADVGEERDLIDLSDGVAVLRVDEIVPATTRPLEDVRDAVIASWTAQETARQMAVLAESLIARIDMGEALADIATELGLSISSEPSMSRSDIITDTPPEFVNTLFETGLGKGFSVPDEGSVLLGVTTAVTAPNLDDEQIVGTLTAVTDSMTASTAQDLVTYFIGALQDDAGVTVNAPLIANIQTQLLPAQR